MNFFFVEYKIDNSWKQWEYFNYEKVVSVRNG